MGAINADVLLQLDERSARAVSDQAMQHLSRAGNDAGSAFNTSFSRHLGAVSSQMQRTGREASAAFQREIDTGFRNMVSGATTQFGSLGRVADSALSGISTKAAAAGLGIGAIVVGVGLATKALYDLGKQWDDISDSITISTGKTGDELKQLTDLVGKVGSTTAASLGAIGSISTQVSQAMPDLAQHNAAMQQLVSNLSYLDANGKSVDILQLSRAFRVFGVEAGGQTVKAFDDLATASRDTGIPINELINMVRAGAPQFREFGLGIGQATSLLASFSQAGVDPETAVTGLKIALRNLNSDSRGAAVALGETITQIKALHDAGNDPGASQLAESKLGKGFAAFLPIIKDGTLNAQSLNKSLTDLGIPLAALQQKTDDGQQGFTKLTNTIKTTLGPVADTVFGGINKYLTSFVDEARYLSGGFDDAAQSLRDLAAIPITPDSALGQMLNPGGPNAVQGNTPLPLPTTAPTVPTTGLGPNPYTTPGSSLYYPQLKPGDPGYAGPDDGRQRGGSSAAQVPYGALPAIGSGVPMTSEVYSSQSSLWEAQHNVAEKEAELTKLRASNTTKNEDLIKAQNDVDKANRDRTEAEMRFAKTQQDAYQAQFKQLNKAADSLNDVGAKLDSDFGVSKGLAGVVENITKMLGNLAMAPVIGALTGVQVANGFKPGDAGSGMAGILASSGAFGPQFVPHPQQSGGTTGGAYPSAVPGGTGGPYPGDAALLSGVPSGSYNPSGDLSKGLGDCSSAVEDLVNIMDGKGTAGRSLATSNASQWLPQHGFLPGEGGPGDFRVGYNDHHMQATLPGGTPFNWGSDAAAANRGIGGTGADDPAFTQHYYRPTSGGGGGAPTSTGGGGGSWAGANTVAGSPGQGYPLPVDSPFGHPTNPGPQDPTGGLLNGPLATPGAPGAPGPTGGWFGGGGSPSGVGGAGAALLGGARGADPSQSVAGGRSFGQDLPASGGIGFSGGIIGAAMSAAAGMAAGPGGGAAAAGSQLAIQEIGRAVGAGSQYAGNVAGGLLETFSLNDSALGDPSHSWLGKGLTAVTGVRPQLPNPNMLESGKPKPPGPLTPEQAKIGSAAKGQGQGDTTHNETNINVTNNRATEDGTGRDIQAHLGAQASASMPTR